VLAPFHSRNFSLQSLFSVLYSLFTLHSSLFTLHSSLSSLSVSNLLSLPPFPTQALAYNASPTPDSSFQYAFALCRSHSASERAYGVGMMDTLVASDFPHAADCVVSQAVASYLSEHYKEARAYAEAVLRTNPGSEKAREIHLAAIAQVEEKEKAMNMAVGGGVLAVGVTVLSVGLGLLLGGKKR